MSFRISLGVSIETLFDLTFACGCPLCKCAKKLCILANLALNLKLLSSKDKNADLSNHGMTHRLPDRVFTEFSFAPQAEIGSFCMNFQKFTVLSY